MTKIRLFLADDHRVLLAGLKSLINSQSDMETVGTADTGQAAIEGVRSLHPDVVLLDLNMPNMNGLDVVETLRNDGLKTKIIALTMHEEEEYLRAFVEKGGNGYMLKQSSEQELLSAVRNVARGSYFVDPLLAGKLVSAVWSCGIDQNHETSSELSDREMEVLRLTALGYTNEEIAEKLVVSIETVESHKANIKSKLNIQTRAELVRFAMARKVI